MDKTQGWHATPGRYMDKMDREMSWLLARMLAWEPGVMKDPQDAKAEYEQLFAALDRCKVKPDRPHS